MVDAVRATYDHMPQKNVHFLVELDINVVPRSSFSKLMASDMTCERKARLNT